MFCFQKFTFGGTCWPSAPSLVIFIFLNWWKCCLVSLYNNYYPLITNKFSEGRHFQIIFYSSSDFHLLNILSIYNYYLNKSLKHDFKMVILYLYHSLHIYQLAFYWRKNVFLLSICLSVYLPISLFCYVSVCISTLSYTIYLSIYYQCRLVDDYFIQWVKIHLNPYLFWYSIFPRSVQEDPL